MHLMVQHCSSVTISAAWPAGRMSPAAPGLTARNRAAHRHHLRIALTARPGHGWNPTRHLHRRRRYCLHGPRGTHRPPRAWPSVRRLLVNLGHTRIRYDGKSPERVDDRWPGGRPPHDRRRAWRGVLGRHVAPTAAPRPHPSGHRTPWCPSGRTPSCSIISNSVRSGWLFIATCGTSRFSSRSGTCSCGTWSRTPFRSRSLVRRRCGSSCATICCARDRDGPGAGAAQP